MTPEFTSAWDTLVETVPPARLGRPLRVYESLGSTNDVLRELAHRGAPEGATVVARSQTRGRGRHGRTWSSPAGQGLYMSVLLRPALPSRDAGWLAVLSGVGVARALETVGLPGVSVKWPNDVYAGDRKIAGVLAEPRLARGLIEFAVLGLGVNVGQGEEDFPMELRATATSLRLQGVDIPVDHVGNAVRAAVEACYREVKGGKTERGVLFEEWKVRGGLDLLPEIT